MKTREKIKEMDIEGQHFEHKMWLNKLSFYVNELKVFEHRLEELVAKDIKQLLPNLEQFQNNFITQKEVLDELGHGIRMHEEALIRNAGNGPNIRGVSQHNHEEMQDKMETFAEIYAEQKQEFIQFLTNCSDLWFSSLKKER